MREDEAILDRAGLALVGVADDVLFGAGLLAHDFPFRFGGKSRAAQASKARSFQQLEGGIPVARLHQSPDDAVALARGGIRVRGAFHAAARGDRFRQRPLRNYVADHFFNLRFGQPRIDTVVDSHGRRLIASAEARRAAHNHIGAAQILKPLFQARAKTVGTAKVAGHVLADADVRLGGRRETKMRIKAGDSVQAVQGNVNLLRQILQFFSRQVTEPMLDLPQRIEDQLDSPHTEGRSFPRRNQSRLSVSVTHEDITNRPGQVHKVSGARFPLSRGR